MKNHSIFRSFIFCLIMLSHGCVTINIYFPAAAAEKAADKVIDEIWQLPADGQGTSNNTQTPSKNKQPATTGGEK